MEVGREYGSYYFAGKQVDAIVDFKPQTVVTYAHGCQTLGGKACVVSFQHTYEAEHAALKLQASGVVSL